MKAKKENVIFTYRGNGLIACDKNVQEYGDYKILAHIRENGTIKYYCSVSQDAKKEIEKMEAKKKHYIYNN